MNTSSKQWSDTVFERDTLLKIKGLVPMSLKPLLMRSLKTTTSHGCMITKTKTQDASLRFSLLTSQQRTFF
jgi:hypothetical protein